MILALLLAAQGYSPETEAVMKRSQERAAQARAAEQTQPSENLPVSPEVAAKFQACLDQAIDDPDKGAQFAEAWRIDRGGFHARQCQGFAYARAERWVPAATAFEQAAAEAERAGAVRDSARLLAQSGNAALAGGSADVARLRFDAALARGLPDGLEKGEVYLDRARAKVALGDQPGARSDFGHAVELAPADPLAWLLSATLARRMNDLTLARQHIAQAVKLSPDDPAVALEEGNVAVLSSQDAVARSAWERAVRLAPDSASGKAAAANLAELGPAPPTTGETR
jgi:tetratricopeptide (TPR) repeat protein